MKILYFLLVCLLLNACNSQIVPAKATTNRKCSPVEKFNLDGYAMNVTRCEMDNNEVCYISSEYDKGGVSCFKQ